MRATHHTHEPYGSATSAAARIAVALGLLGSFVALLVAASYPTLAAAAAGGALFAGAVRYGLGQFDDSEGICVPGTDVCFRTPS